MVAEADSKEHRFPVLADPKKTKMFALIRSMH